jgi:hypothetical protein
VALLSLFAALALPVALGAFGAGLALKPGTPGRVLAVTGNGILLGLMAATFALRLLDDLGFPPTFAAATPLLLVVLTVFAVIYRRWYAAAVVPALQLPGMAAGDKALLVVFVLLIGLRIVTLGLELIWRPLFPWDATMHWATKAKVWLDAGALVPFVDNQTWLELAGKGVSTDHHADYPRTIPLLQLWMSSALGYWDESLINLPWLLLLIALGALFYGQGRAAGVGRKTALIFTYLLLSLPLLNIHIALAGYADLFLGAFYCAALAAFYNWSQSRETGQAVMAAFFALCCPLIKNEGLFWLLTLLPALFAVFLPARWSLSLLACCGLVGSALIIMLPGDLIVAGHSLNSLELGYRPGMLANIGRSLLVFDNWHLFGYLLLAAIALVACLDPRDRRRLLGPGIALFSALVLFIFLFTATRYARGALQYTAVNRIALHLVPAMMFFVLVVTDGLLRRAGAMGSRDGEAPAR